MGKYFASVMHQREGYKLRIQDSRHVLPHRTAVELYLNGNRLVVFETAKTVFRFQGVSVGILGRVKRCSWQVRPASTHK